MPEQKRDKNRRNCYKCNHFYITWEHKHPNGCRRLRFKSRQLPSVVVFQSSGKPCEFFKEKINKTSSES